MSREAKWIWKAETPPGVPAGARISAGKSGRVERSLPTCAVAAVKRSPTSCMPSPESPAKRTITVSGFLDVVLTNLPCYQPLRTAYGPRRVGTRKRTRCFANPPNRPLVRPSSELDDAANSILGLHQLEAPVDFIEGEAMRRKGATAISPAR